MSKVKEVKVTYNVYEDALKRIKKVCNLYQTCGNNEDVVIQQDSAIIIQNALEIAITKSQTPSSDEIVKQNKEMKALLSEILEDILCNNRYDMVNFNSKITMILKKYNGGE